MDSLYFILIVIAVIFSVGGGFYLKRKFNISQDESNLIKLTLQVFKYLASQIEINNADLIEKIIGYLIEAIQTTENFELLNSFERNELLKEKALEIAQRENLNVDKSFIDLVDAIIDYLNTSEIIQQIK